MSNSPSSQKRRIENEGPSYLRLLGTGDLRERASRALEGLSECTYCPRQCGVNRLDGEVGVCGVGRFAKVSSAFPHFGEERVLVGRKGSGTIFFSECNLGCIFCQNYEISHGGEGREVRDEELAGLMLGLQGMGCHNINLVTPSHVVPQVLSALSIAAERGLRVPIVYNTSAYDTVETLMVLEGVVDIYMPDFKFWSEEAAKIYLRAKDYPEVARKAILEMHRQVGDLLVDGRGIAVRGLLVRHLVMPGFLEDSEAIMRFLASVSPHTYVNIMAQYRPLGEAHKYEKIARRPTWSEVEAVREAALRAGLYRLDPG